MSHGMQQGDGFGHAFDDVGNHAGRNAAGQREAKLNDRDFLLGVKAVEHLHIRFAGGVDQRKGEDSLHAAAVGRSSKCLQFAFGASVVGMEDEHLRVAARAQDVLGGGDVHHRVVPARSLDEHRDGAGALGRETSRLQIGTIMKFLGRTADFFRDGGADAAVTARPARDGDPTRSPLKRPR